MHVYLWVVMSRLCIWANNKEFIDLMNIKSIGDDKYVEHFVIAFDTAHLLFNFMSNLFIFVIQLLFLILFLYHWVSTGVPKVVIQSFMIFLCDFPWENITKTLLIMLSLEYNEITVKFIDMVLSTVITVLRIK